MSIDIDHLSEKELVDLNRRIIQKLRMLEAARAGEAMAKFSVREKVTFHPSDREPVTGVLVKYNKKSVTVITEDGEHWNVAPGLLEKAEELAQREFRSHNQHLN